MFPSLECADDDGLLAFGGDLEVATLELAYRSGIFPWPVDGSPTLWFAPPQRAVLHFEDFHVSRRLARQLKKDPFEIRIDTSFVRVIRACAKPRSDAANRADEEESSSGTWISPDIIRAYTRLHKRQTARGLRAHSAEAYRDGELVGGLYGVSRGAYFCGESMFHRQSSASKAALIALVEQLQDRGATWLDTQMMTPLFDSFGTRLIARDDFMAMLQRAWNRDVRLFD